MAREHEWHRWYAAFAGDSIASPVFAEQLDIMPEGYTLTRTRFNYLCQHVPEFGGEACGIPVVVGLIVVPGLHPDVIDIPTPVSTPNADYLFIDDGMFVPYRVQNGSDETFELDIAQPRGGPCDAKSQRRAEVDSSLWIVAEIDDTLTAQGTFYFSYSGSSLFLLP